MGDVFLSVEMGNKILFSLIVFGVIGLVSADGFGRNGYWNKETDECWSSKDHPSGIPYGSNYTNSNSSFEISFFQCCFNQIDQQVDCSNSNILIGENLTTPKESNTTLITENQTQPTINGYWNKEIQRCMRSSNKYQELIFGLPKYECCFNQEGNQVDCKNESRIIQIINPVVAETIIISPINKPKENQTEIPIIVKYHSPQTQEINQSPILEDTQEILIVEEMLLETEEIIIEIPQPKVLDLDLEQKNQTIITKIYLLLKKGLKEIVNLF